MTTPLPIAHPAADLLSAFALGNLSERDLADIGRHLAHCANCRAQAELAGPDPFVHQLRNGAQADLPSLLRGLSPLAVSSFPGNASTIRRGATGGRPSRTIDYVPSQPAPHFDWPQLPGLVIQSKLGEGGMGVVYLAEQPELGRQVAVKMILAGAAAGEQQLGRFHAEAEAVARLQHPNIVQIHELGAHLGQSYVVLEYVTGGSLGQQLKSQPPTPDHAAKLLETLARAMHHAHERGIVHRDLKPGNVLLTADGTPKIADFGLAKMLERHGDLSQPGLIIGTPKYMAPEQAEGRSDAIGPAVDVWALGVILYEMMVGNPPFEGSHQAVLFNLMHQDPIPPRQRKPKLPRDLEAICLKCLRRDPHKRYASALELAEDLRRFRAGEPIAARSVGPVERLQKWARRQPVTASLLVATMLALLGGIAVASYFAWREHHAAQGKALEAQKAKDEADNVRKGKAFVNRLLYASQLNLAQRTLTTSRAAGTLEMLDAQRPERTDNVDLRGWEWYHLKRLLHGDLLAYDGHRGPVRMAVWHPDGRRIVSAGDDHTVRLWDAESGKDVRVFRGHTGAVICAAISPDGRRIASGSVDASVRVWDVETGKETGVLASHILPVQAVAFSPDGRWLATAGADAVVFLRDAGDLSSVRVLQGHQKLISSLTFSPDNQLLVSTSEDDTVRIWDVASGKVRHTLQAHRAMVNDAAFSPDGKELASAGSDHTIRLWNVADGQLKATIEGGNYAVTSVRYLSDGQQLATSSHDQTLRIWNVADMREVRRYLGHRAGVYWVDVSPPKAGKARLASAGGDGLVKVWDADRAVEGLNVLGHDLRITSAVFSPDGKLLITGSEDHRVRLWDTNGRERLTLGRHQVKRDEKTGAVRSIGTISGHGSLVNSVAVSPDGKLIASCSHDKRVIVWDARTGAEVLTFQHSAGVTGVAFHPSGKKLASSSWDRTVRIWDLAIPREPQVLSGHPGYATCVAYSPDGDLLASGGDDGIIRLWDASTGKETRQLLHRGGDVHCLAFSPDGRRLASGGEDLLVRLWNVATGEQERVLAGHLGTVHAVAFSPDGKRLASAGMRRIEGVVKLWDPDTGQELVTLNDAAMTVAFSPDGKRLATGGRPRYVRIWDSRPVDDQPRRLAEVKPLLPEPPERSLSPSLKVLGWYKASKLAPGPGAKKGEPIEVPRPNLEFMIVVLSHPDGAFVPTDADYLVIQKEHAADPDEGPVPSRDRLARYDPRRFQLILPDGRAQRGQLLSAARFPPLSEAQFTPGSLVRTSSKAIDVNVRSPLLIGWILPTGTPTANLQVRLDQEDAVPLPDVRLAP